MADTDDVVKLTEDDLTPADKYIIDAITEGPRQQEQIAKKIKELNNQSLGSMVFNDLAKKAKNTFSKVFSRAGAKQVKTSAQAKAKPKGLGSAR